MQPYSSEFKEAVLARILSGEISLNAASRTYKLAFSTVRKWRDQALCIVPRVRTANPRPPDVNPRAERLSSALPISVVRP